MKKITVSILSVMLMLSMVFSSSVFAAEKEQSAWDSFVGLFAAKAPAAESEVGVEYRGHIQNVGNYPLDGTWVQGPAELGTEGKGLRLEGFWIKLNGEVPADTHIQYQVHVQNVGWMDPVQDGAFAGTEGKSLQIEAIKIKLVDDNGDLVKDYSVVYSGHVQNVGDVGPFTNGEKLGTEGSFLRLEAIEVEIVQNKADLTAYEEALAAVKEADYTPASWAAYQEVVEANVVTEDSLQSEVDAATAAIVEAQKDLVELGEVVGIVAINATTVEVTFADDVTEVDKSEFVIDGLAVNNAAIKQTNKKVVVLTTAAQEGAKVYGLTYQGVDTGLTFTGISAVLPTAIKIADGTNFVTVGQEFTVKATVTTTDANKAGIPVTFNIKSPAGSLNQNIVEERLTNADGVAEYTYTRYATDIDNVSVYPTGAAAVRDVRDITWSAQPMLSVVTSEDTVLANGAAKTYTVTLRNRNTGNPVGANEWIYVLFNENIGAINGTNAVATDVSTGQSKTPSQRATGDADALLIKTNSDGKATFTVTGSNTTATPIVYTDNNVSLRLDATDLQLWAPAVTFKGAQTTHVVTVTPDTQATVAAADGVNDFSGRVYTVDVKKADGSAFAGGVVQIAFNELIDNNIGTDTQAQFVWYDNDSVLRTTVSADKAPAGTKQPVVGETKTNNNQLYIQLNAEGKATFQITDSKLADTATPIVWIDQDSTTVVTNHKLETTEPSDLGGVTITEAKAINSAKLAVDNDAQALNTPATVTYSILDQNGVETPAGDVRVTYTIVNTGANALTITDQSAGTVIADRWSINGATNDFFGNYSDAAKTIGVGKTATVAVTLANPNPNTKIGLQAAGVTSYSISAQGLVIATNKSLPAAAITGSFTELQNVDDITVPGEFVTGTITSFSTTDKVYANGKAQSGKIVIAVDGQPGQFAWFTYNKGRVNNVGDTVIDLQNNDNLFVGADSSFVNNNTATNAQFESALSVGNKVRIDNIADVNNEDLNNISLYNVNLTNISSQINQTLPADVTKSASIKSAIDSDTNADGIVDTVKVQFKDQTVAPITNLPIVASSVSITDFAVDNATITNYSTGLGVNDNEITLTITPNAGFETAPLGDVNIVGTIDFTNGTSLSTGSLAIEDKVGPKLLTATLGTATNATAALTATGGNTIQLAIDPANTNFAGAYGNTVDFEILNTAGPNPVTAVWADAPAAGTANLSIDLNGSTITLNELVALINTSAAGKVKATLPVGANGLDIVVPTAADVLFTTGTDVVTATFSETTTVAPNGLTFAAAATTGTAGAAGTTVTYTINTAAAKIVTGGNVTPVAASVKDVALNLGSVTPVTLN